MPISLTIFYPSRRFLNTFTKPTFLQIMKKVYQTLLAFALLLASQTVSFAQCQFIFKGTLAGKAVTVCFLPDENDGQVHGEYYYGKGDNGVMTFTGTAIRQNDGSYRQRLEEANAEGTVTGYFTGTLKNGVMAGTWTSTDGKRSFPYKLVLQK